MDSYDYMHCPSITCDARLTPPWSNYLINNSTYKCPYCGFTFTTDSIGFNSIKVPHNDCKYVIVKDEEIVQIIDSEQVTSILDEYYITVQTFKLKPPYRLYMVPSDIPDNRLIESINHSKE